MSESLHRDGVRPRREFNLRLWSGKLAARLEGAVVIVTFAAVIGIMVILVQAPGPLVVHVQDDTKEALVGAKVRCTSPDGTQTFAGQTDVFGEAKWPGLVKGPWRCQVEAPLRYHAAAKAGLATVVARTPAIWVTSIERPSRVLVKVGRPAGSPRALLAVRAVCEPVEPSAGPASWEARIGLLDGQAILFVPHGKRCQVGLVHPELSVGEGPVAQPVLACAEFPCVEVAEGSVGEVRELALTPTAAQWEALRPPPQPDKPEP